MQDDDEASFARGSRTRISGVPAAGGAWRPAREFIYPLDAVAAGGFRANFFINGLVELLALGNSDLLALERSFATTGNDSAGFNRIRLYRVSLTAADDVSESATLAQAGSARTLDKHVVLDLADTRGLSSELAALDNFEGLAFGPRLADGSPSLIMVSDDNFNARQVTAFLMFRIVPRSAPSPRARR